jgi:hypothetical protein
MEVDRILRALNMLATVNHIKDAIKDFSSSKHAAIAVHFILDAETGNAGTAGKGDLLDRSVDSELRNQSSHWVSCVPKKTIYLQNKNRTATCFCHTILEFAAAEKSLELHGHKIGINSSWTGV